MWGGGTGALVSDQFNPGQQADKMDWVRLVVSRTDNKGILQFFQMESTFKLDSLFLVWEIKASYTILKHYFRGPFT